MNRISRGTQHRRGRSVTAIPKDSDDSLDLFSRNRRSHSVASSVESGVTMKLGRISVGSVTLAKTGMDNLLSSVDGGKHDYDWLLTPPETPLFSSSDASEPQPTITARKSSSTFRSVSTTKASRLSMAQSDNSYSSKPTRSSSVTRPSISTMSYSTYSSSSNRSSSVLNTSSASVTSISRPSTPGSRSVSSRPSTPVKSRPTLNGFSGERPRTSQNSRPSTPTSRPQIPANLNSGSARTNPRPSTPSHRNAAPSPSPVIGRSASAGQVLTNGRIPAAASRGSSPSPRTRPLPQPIVPPDFPLETPPNLRTTLPDRPLSAGRSRPSSAVTIRGNPDAPGLMTQPRRQSSSPIVTRGRLHELSGKGRLHNNGHDFGGTENQKTPPISESAARRSSKSVTTTESTGFGRTISKKSLDMALRHMDILNGSANANARPLSGTTLFPQSIHSATLKRQPARGLDALASITSNGAAPIGSNISISENGNYNARSQVGEAEEADRRLCAKVNELDIYESSRYDAFLLREDMKNTNWLHSIDGKSDEGVIFDHRFDLLPEPFDPL